MSDVKDPGYLFNTGQIGLKSVAVSSGVYMLCWPFFHQTIEVIYEMDGKTDSFMVGAMQDSLQVVESIVPEFVKNCAS